MDWLKEDATIEMDKVNKIVSWASILIIAIVVLLYHIIWGISGLDSGLHFVFIIVMSFVLIGVHELLHGIGFKFFGKVAWTDIKYGIMWKELMPYAHCKKEIGINAYRAAVLLPLIVLGIIPMIIGLVVGNGVITTVGTWMTVAALGDVIIFYLLLPYDARCKIKDHPDKIGCEVYYQERG
jgi:ABC-type branched-subunit amino acid transport system permease subunit